MKRSVLYLAIILIATVVLSGCGQVIGLVLKPDLTVENISVSEGPDGWTGMSITIGNWGGPTDNDAEYAIYLSYGSSINPATDFKVYEDEVEVEWNSEKIVYLNFATDVDPYIEANGLFIPEGDLYLGVFMDPEDKETERDEQNNDSTVGPFLFGGGGSATVAPDEYEDDGLPPGADLGWDDFQQRTFHTEGDVDWMRVYLYNLETVRIQTLPGAGLPVDTELWVYDDVVPFQPGFDPSDFVAFPPVAYSDDDGFDQYVLGTWSPNDDPMTEAPYSAVQFIAPHEGWFLVRVGEYYGNVGTYDVHFYSE